ncbi:MAG: hypothetical protein ACSLFA_25920, partial [Mycobacterium sp.]
YIPAPGLLTPWGQPPRVRDIKTPNDIITTTTVPDADSNLVSLVTEPADSAAETEIAVTEPATAVVETAVEAAVEPVTEAAVEPVTTQTETAVETPESTETVTPVTEDSADTLTDETDIVAETTQPAKPAKKDPAAGFRQGIKDFRDNVDRTVKKLSGGGTSSRSDSPSGSDKKESTTSESTGPKDSE